MHVCYWSMQYPVGSTFLPDDPKLVLTHFFLAGGEIFILNLLPRQLASTQDM